MVRSLLIVILFMVLSGSVFPCAAPKDPALEYKWEQVTASAEYPVGYNYPVFVLGDTLLALNNCGWLSEDGKNWKETKLGRSGLNSAFQRYVQFNGAIYALGTMTGNIESMKLSSRISKTTDGRTWKVVAEKSDLPERVFYGTAVFQNKIWLFGGLAGDKEMADVWNSPDVVRWTKVGDHMPWRPRQNPKIVVFREKLLLIGDNDVWSSDDGLKWSLLTPKMAENPVFISGYSAAVFDDKIWLVGINRNGTFQSGVLFSEDGKTWREMQAPWTPRGAVAVWVNHGKLFMTGGKSSYVENGTTKFVYSNDVWALSKSGSQKR